MTILSSAAYPAASLKERLLLGGAPDDELFYRAGLCREFFDENPLEKLRWWPRLKKAALAPALVGGIDFWRPIIEPILQGDPPAPAQNTVLHPHALPTAREPEAPALPEHSAEEIRAGMARLAGEFSAWIASLNGGWERLRELAPCIADEVLALSARADAANSLEAARQLHRQARKLVADVLAVEAWQS